MKNMKYVKYSIKYSVLFRKRVTFEVRRGHVARRSISHLFCAPPVVKCGTLPTAVVMAVLCRGPLLVPSSHPSKRLNRVL